MDADGATVTCKLLDAAGVPTGPDLTLQAAPPLTNPPLVQYAPGQFRFTSTGAPLTRGNRYRATYAISVGGGVAETVTQDFTAFSQALHPRPTEFLAFTTLAMRNVVRRALGLKEEVPPSQPGQEPGAHSSLEYVNMALEALWREHRWTWQLAEPAYLDIVGGQTRIPLPDDYLEIKSLQRAGASMVNFIESDLEEIAFLREKAPGTPGWDLRYAVVSDPPHEATGRVAYAIEVFPPPAGYIQAGAILHYYRQCPVVTNNTDLIPFPTGFQQVAVLACRVEAFEGEGDTENAAAERTKFEAKLLRVIGADARHGPRDCGSMIRDDHDPSEGRDWTGHDPYARLLTD